MPGAFAMRNAVPVAAHPSLYWGYGLGQQWQRWGDTTAVGHSGNTSGYTSQVWYDTSRAFGVIVLRSAGADTLTPIAWPGARFSSWCHSSEEFRRDLRVRLALGLHLRRRD